MYPSHEERLINFRINEELFDKIRYVMYRKKITMKKFFAMASEYYIENNDEAIEIMKKYW
jgi:hypothetical protein